MIRIGNVRRSRELLHRFASPVEFQLELLLIKTSANAVLVVDGGRCLRFKLPSILAAWEPIPYDYLERTQKKVLSFLNQLKSGVLGGESMRFVLGVLLGAVAMFLWSFVFWMVIPYPGSVLNTLPNQDLLVPALQAAIPADGVYLVPAAEESEEVMAQKEQGPVATIMFQKGGAEPMDKTMIRGFVHMLGCSFLLAIAVATAGRRTFLGRFVLIFWIGLFVAIWTEMSTVIWFLFPIRYACLQMTYHLSAIAVLGLVLAFFIRPPADPALD